MKARKAYFLRSPETRRERLGLKPDIDRELLATLVFFGKPLQDYEREFVARLVEPAIADLLIGAEPPKKKKKGRPPSTTVAVKHDEIAETYYFRRALWPRDKHKEHACPAVAKQLGVSERSVDEALKRTDPARRAEMKAAAAAFAEGLAEVQWLNHLGLMNDALAIAYADRAYAKAGYLPSYDTVAKRAARTRS